MRFAPCASWGFSPLDRELGLLPGSPLLPRAQEMLVQLATQIPFAAASRLFETWTGIKLGSSTTRRQTLAAGEALVAAETAAAEWVLRDSPEPTAAGVEHQQLSIDGALVPLIGEWAEVKTLAVGTVTERSGGEPKATDLSYFSRLCDHRTFTRLATVETHRRATELARQVTVVVDGAEWLQDFADIQCPQATRIIDWTHSSEYVAAAARALFGEPDALAAWRQAQLHELWEGDPELVLTELCERLTALSPNSEAAAVVSGSILYLARRLEQLQYARFRAEGRPTGSGCVESANKLIVEARLKGAGMHWRRENVNPMLALRNTYCSANRWSGGWALLDRYRCARSGELARAQHQARNPTPSPPPSRPRKRNWRQFSLRPRPRHAKP